MSVTQDVAGRSRLDDSARGFVYVTDHTRGEFCPNPPSDDYGTAWKGSFFRRISARAPGLARMSRAQVLLQLARIADRNGQIAISIEGLAGRTNGDRKTVRRVIHFLAKEGAWLRVEAMTWGALAAKFPRWRIPNDADPRGDGPNLYTLLDGQGQPAAESLGRLFRHANLSPGVGADATKLRRTRSRLTPQRGTGPASESAPVTDAASESAPTPPPSIKTTNEEVSLAPPPPQEGGFPSLPKREDVQRIPFGDLDLKERERSESAPEGRSTLSLVSNSSGELEEGWQEAWAVLVRAHFAQCNTTYGAEPGEKQFLKPEMPLDAGRRFAKIARLFAHNVRHRCGVELGEREAQEKLAAKTMEKWFAGKGKGDFLETASHPIGKLCEELNGQLRRASDDLLIELSRPKETRPPRSPEEIQAERAAKAKQRAADEATARAAALEASRAIKANFKAFLGFQPTASQVNERARQDAFEQKRADARRALASMAAMEAKQEPTAAEPAPNTSPVDAPLLARGGPPNASTREGAAVHHASAPLDHVAAPLGPSARQGVPDTEDAATEGGKPPPE